MLTVKYDQMLKGKELIIEQSDLQRLSVIFLLLGLELNTHKYVRLRRILLVPLLQAMQFSFLQFFEAMAEQTWLQLEDVDVDSEEESEDRPKPKERGHEIRGQCKLVQTRFQLKTWIKSEFYFFIFWEFSTLFNSSWIQLIQFNHSKIQFASFYFPIHRNE